MRIVIDARESGTTTGRYVDKLIENLQKIDQKNEYILIYKKDRINSVEVMRANFTKIETNYKEFTFGEQIGFARQLYRLKADLVHFPLVHHPILYFRKSVIGILDLTTIRFYNPAKNKIAFWIKQKIYAMVIFIAGHKAKHIITISNFVRDDIVKNFHINPAKITTTYGSADELQSPGVAVDSLLGKKYIMYVGRHQPHKNLQRLIDAYKILLRDDPQLILAIVGKLDATTALLRTQNSELEPRLLFTGFVSDAELRWLYENTACYVFPSLSEGFGLPGLEAMRHGAPVASSRATCLPEIYGDTAAYFSPYSSKEMAQVIEDVIVHKKLRASLVAKGKKQVAKYSWLRMAEQTLVVYKEALQKK